MIQAVLASLAGAGGFVRGEEIDVGTGPAVLQTVSGKGVGRPSGVRPGVKNAKGRPPLYTRHHNAARWIGALSRIRCDKTQPVSCDGVAPCVGAPSEAASSDAIASARVMRPTTAAATGIKIRSQT
jgi:hypothetical protein